MTEAFDRRLPGIAGNLAAIRGRIAGAAARAGREAREILLVAVSKTVPESAVHEAVAAGQRVFGESRVQEARRKIPALGPGLTWHLIGHLQRNKAKTAVELFHLLEALDSAELAGDLSRHAVAAGRRLPVLVQVRLGGEATKSGVDPEDAARLIETAVTLPGIEVAGLMTIPPPPRAAEDSRPFFRRLRELRDRWDGACCPRGTLRELSMGMTSDFEVAVEEGATIIRVGTALFGDR